MVLRDQAKNFARKLIEDRPDRTALGKLVQKRKPLVLSFADDGIVPNNPHFPVLIYRGAIFLRTKAFSPGAVMDALFETNGWGRSWRDTVYDFVHYHSQVHEVMGVASGSATIECGGIKGRMVTVKPGDVIVLPAGTGHRLIEATTNFQVVGAYPKDGTYDECTDTRDRAEAVKRIAKVHKPAKDPVYGKAGVLRKTWQR